MSQRPNRDVTLHQLLISNTSQLEEEAADAPSRQKSQLMHSGTNGVFASLWRLYTSFLDVQMILIVTRMKLSEKMISEHVNNREKRHRLLLSPNIMMT